MNRRAMRIVSFSESAIRKAKPLHIEKRRCARVAVGFPISCVSLDSKGKPCDQNKGIVRNVSQKGLKIEAQSDVRSDQLKLTISAFDKNIAEITGKVVFSQKTPSGTFKIGVEFEGNKPDVIRFVSRLVRFHHYTKSKICTD